MPLSNWLIHIHNWVRPNYYGNRTDPHTRREEENTLCPLPFNISMKVGQRNYGVWQIHLKDLKPAHPVRMPTSRERRWCGLDY